MSRERARLGAMASQGRAVLVACACALGLSIPWAALPVSLEDLLQLPLERILELKVAPMRTSHTDAVQVAQVGVPPAVGDDDAA